MEIDQAVADRLRYLREGVLKLTLEAFGEVIDLSGPMVQLMETAKRKITPRTRNSICGAFKVSRMWIDTGVGEIFTESKIAEARAEYDLYGGWKPDPEKASGFSGESREWAAMGQLYHLLKSGDDTLKRAIIANLDAFTSAMDTKESNLKLSDQVASLTDRLTTMEQQLQRQGLVVIERRGGEDRRTHDEPYTGEERRAGGDRRKQGPGS